MATKRYPVAVGQEWFEELRQDTNSTHEEGSSNDFEEIEPQRSQYILRNLETEILKSQRHIVQIEAILIYIIISICTLGIVQMLFTNNQSNADIFIKWIVPCLLLSGVAVIIRVLNPISLIRNALLWATSFGSLGAAIGGALTLLGTVNLPVGHSTLIGMGIAAPLGAIITTVLSFLGDRTEYMERGDAFKYLYKRRRRSTRLANPTLIKAALDKIPRHIINEDDKSWYFRADLDEFIKKNK